VSPASDEYFLTLRIPVLEGRAISEDDVHQVRSVAVINHLFASRYFAGEEPLGRQITVGAMANPPYMVKSPTFEIVGVVEDFRNNGNDPPQPALYVPCTVEVEVGGSYMIRTGTAPGLLVNSLRRETASMDNELPVNVGSLEDVLTQGFFAEPRFVMALMSVFAAMGLVLVLVGVYSVLSYSVTQRTREVGIRLAMGAEVGDVLGMLLGSGLRWLLIGIGLGVPASAGLAKALQNRIWGLKAADPITLASTAGLLIAAGLAACYIPARRATKVDPMVALRYE
jgi:putative ABC transport system permease protein